MITRRLVTNAVVTMLETATSLPVGRGKAPAGVDKPPYFIVYTMPLEVSGAPLADQHEDASIVYQVTSVSGPDPDVPESAGELEQTEWLADKARSAFLARHPSTGLWMNPITVTGFKVTDRSLDTEAGGTSDPADAILTYVQRFRLGLTPA